MRPSHVVSRGWRALSDTRVNSYDSEFSGWGVLLGMCSFVFLLRLVLRLRLLTLIQVCNLYGEEKQIGRNFMY